jgi:phosphate:Na+ symporter
MNLAASSILAGIGAVSSGPLEIGAIVVGALGGLALFLYGMEVMTGAVKAVAGAGMKGLLARLTSNRLRAAFTGAFVTAVIQSSSVTTVLVVGFVTAGLLTLSQSIGVIMGANIGSTVTAQIIAFKVTGLAFAMVAVGYLVRVLIKREKIRLTGSAVFGLGLLFLGMNTMGEATSTLRDHPPFLEMMKHMDNPVWAILFGTLFTGLIQSSAATTGIVIVLAGRGFLTLEAGIALTLGANVGTCVTAVLASLDKPREARQAAAVHVIFNLLGVVLWVGLISGLADFVRRMTVDLPRQIAMAHTTFNVANTLIFIWFTRPLAALVRAIVPGRPSGEPEPLEPKYLDPALLQTPELAFPNLRRETVRLGTRAQHMLHESVPAVLRGRRRDLDSIDATGDHLDTLFERIVEFAGRLSQGGLTESQTRRLSSFLSVINHVQNVSETIRVNLLALGKERIERGITVSEITAETLEPLRQKVIEAFETSMGAFAMRDPERAESVIVMKEEINRLSRVAKDHLVGRLTAHLPNREWTFRLESEVVENLKRLYYFSKRIAKVVLDLERGLAPSKTAA